jgi:Kef-type K+ transport system membrane component KefB
VAATVLSYVARLLRQPLLLGYIAAGVAIGPLGLGWIHDFEEIQQLAELGLAFLLFIVGLEIDVKKLAAAGKTAAVTTLVQVAGSGLLAWGAALALGMRGLPAAYVGAALAFSSTMIVVKVLNDRSELDTVPGTITLGILLLQDVAAIAVLAVQPHLGGTAAAAEGAASPGVTIALALLKGLGLLVATLAVSRFVLPALFRAVAKSPEIVLLSAVSWCFLVCYGAQQAELSVAMGALLAGASISTFPYTVEVVARIQTLRDFFATLFFVSLGMLIARPTTALLVATVVLTGVVVLSRVLTVLPTLRALGWDNRTGLISALHLAQASEFAVVIVLVGVSPERGHIDRDVVSLIVLTLVVTSTLSTWLIGSSHTLAQRFMKGAETSVLADKHQRETRRHARLHGAPIILTGCFRVGSSLVQDLLACGKQFAVIDFNPHIHTQLKELGVQATYGDLSQLETLQHAGVAEAEMLVASIPDDFLRGTDNLKLLLALRRLNPKARIVVTADSIVRAQELYAAGADYVLVPRVLSARRLREVIEAHEKGELPALRAAEQEALATRREVVP